MLPWILCSLLAMVALAQAVKIRSMQRNMEEICTMFRERLSMDTNTLITVSSGDRHVLRLAREINKELRLLRQQRRKYLHGDLELKEAVTNISHDLRTPITAISGYLELLEREEKSETVERYLAFICNRTVDRGTVRLYAGPVRGTATTGVRGCPGCAGGEYPELSRGHV